MEPILITAAFVVSLSAAIIVQAVLPAIVRPAASIPVTRRGCFLVTPARLLRWTLAIAASVLSAGVVFGIADFTTGAVVLLVGGVGIVGKYIHLRSCVVRVDASGLDPVGRQSPLAWGDVHRIRATPGAWVLTDLYGRDFMVSRGLDGAGCLALHIDEHVRQEVDLDAATRFALLKAYRAGLVEAGEDPDAWLASRCGVVTSVP